MHNDIIDQGAGTCNQEQVQQLTAESDTQLVPTGYDENGRSSKSPNTKEKWKRADKLAWLAIVISIFSVGATFVATYIAYWADKRTQLSDIKGATAVVADLGDKLELLVQSADLSGTFIQAFLDGEKQHPEARDHIKWLEFDLVRRAKLPDLKLSTDKLTLLSHGNGDSAIMLAACASRREQVEADMEELAATKHSDWGREQLDTLHVLPYRLHKLSDICRQAEKSLVTLTPTNTANEPLRGTIGEILKAQEYEERRMKAGHAAQLEVSTTRSKQKKLDSHETTKSKN